MFFLQVRGQQTKDVCRRRADLVYQEITSKISALDCCIKIKDGDNLLAYAFNYKEKGFVIVGNDDALSLISFNPTGFYTLDDSLNVSFTKQTILSGVKKEESLLKASNVEDTVEPLLTDSWGGVNCKDENGDPIMATNIYTPNNCSPGCVAISGSQIMNYYEWPKKGIGSQVKNLEYINLNGSGSWYRHGVYFDHTEYQWDLMKDEYYNVSSTIPEREAVSELFYHVGIAVEMTYGASGSTSHIRNTPFVFENFFRYSAFYQDTDDSDFYTKLYEHMQNGNPVQVGLENSDNGAGHAAVIDGYKVIDNVPYYHINWGFFQNGAYYPIQSWTSASSGYDKITGGVFNIIPVPELTSVVNNNGTIDIQWEVSSKLNYECFELQKKEDDGTWITISNSITNLSYSFPASNNVNTYQFRVRAKVNGGFYIDGWSNILACAKYNNDVDGYISTHGNHYIYGYQTPGYDLDFTDEYTFELWLRLKSNCHQYDAIIAQNGCFRFNLSQVNTNGTYGIGLYNENNKKYLSTTHADLKVEEWVHIAISHLPNSTKIFVNGQLAKSDNTSYYNLSSCNTAINIAERYNNGYVGHLLADIDAVRISNVNRYSTTFTTDRATKHIEDNNTVLLCNFDQPHINRLYNEVEKLSMRTHANIVWGNDIHQAPSSTSNAEFTSDMLFENGDRFIVYPNPTQDIVFIESLDAIEEVIVYSLDGNIEKRIPGNNTYRLCLNLSNSAKGVYLVKMKSKNKITTTKILKK